MSPGDFETQLFHLILRTQIEGWTDKLIEWAQSRSEHAKIKNVVSDLRLIDVEGDPHLVGKSLERTVKEKAF